MMRDRKKIGLITIHHVPNYGSVLQAYATQVLIEKNGFECIMLNYKYPNAWHWSLEPKRKVSLKSKVALWLGLRANHRKAKVLAVFKKDNFHFSKSYESLNALKDEDWSDYAAFVVGSDQVWNPRFTLSDSAFLLSFIPDKQFRFSFASSFASSQLTDKYDFKYKKYLDRFNYLSVREQKGKVLIKDELLLDKEVEIILDPTLLLSKEDWQELCPISKQSNKCKYILLYLLTYAFESRPYVYQVVQYFKNKYGYEVIALAGYAPPSESLGISMANKADASVPQYLNLFANAAMVITTSFHGTAFALNFGIPLVSIVPNEKSDDRQSSLLEALNLQQCIVPISTPMEQINPFYETKDEQLQLGLLRDKSLSWLSTVLSNL